MNDDRALRPLTISSFHGQADLTRRLSVAIKGARRRREPLDHVMLSGPPGLGKTTLANIISHEMGYPFQMVAAPVLRTPEDAAKILIGQKYGSILFIDEIHRLDRQVEEFLYSAMEDYVVSVASFNVKVAPFTLVGATTLPHLLTAPLRMRFGIELTFDFYSAADLCAIVTASAKKLGVTIDPDAVSIIADRSRGTPRIANKLLRRCRDYSTPITSASALLAMESEGIDSDGLGELDRLYLRALSETFGGGPAGVRAIASTLDRDHNTLSETVEPFLLRAGLITRSPRGRCLTEKGRQRKAEAYL